MAEPDRPVSLDDLSPSLGGERAEEPIPETEQASTGGQAGNPFGDDFAQLFGAQAPVDLESLVQTFGMFGATLQSLVTETMQVIETRLPETIAAFEGLIDAVSQALDEPQGQTSTEPVVSEEPTEVQDQDA
jgi:hypothetical protein